jgi:hypothetical protein
VGAVTVEVVEVGVAVVITDEPADQRFTSPEN